MAKIALVLVVLVAASACVHATDEGEKKVIKCYQCSNCTDIGKKDAEKCPDGSVACFIVGNPKKEEWVRGCTPDDKMCNEKKDTDTYACSTCATDECNSGAFVAGSILLSLGMAAIVNMMH